MCMLSAQVTELIVSGALTSGAIVQISDFIINQVAAKRIFIALNCQVLEQYGTYGPAIVIPPFTELLDAQKSAEEQQNGQLPATGQQQQHGYGGNTGGYGSAPPPVNGGGMYGGPPPPVNQNYNANQYQQQGAPPGSMYGGPPPPANGGQPGGGYGSSSGPYGAGGNSYPGGGGEQQQQQGMYGGGPLPQQNGGANGYGGRGGAAPQAGYNPYVAPGGAGGGGGSRPPPQYQAQGAIARDEAPPRIMPISALNPYIARWAIRGRVTSKGELRRWTNVKGEGKVFSFDLLDLAGGDIRATAFGAEADKFFETIEVGAIYQISKASLTQKKPQFNPTSHDYEIRLDRNSLVERVPEDKETSQIPSISFNFRRIADLETAEAGSMVDIIGLVETCDAWQSITRRTGEETQKRSMVVRDESGRSIEVTLWGPLVNNPGDQIEQMVRSGARPVFAAKALRVGDFNGKTLSTIGSSVLRIDPMDLPAAQRLRSWYDGGGRSQAVNSLSSAGMGGGAGGKADRRTTFSAIKGEHLGTSGKPDWITVSAVVDMVKTDSQGGGPSAVVYPSCPHDFNGRPCQKKMMDIGGGNWNCERCNYSTENPAWRYLVSMSACDHTSKQYLTAFGDAGDAIFGRTAAEVRQLEAENTQEFDRLTESIRFTSFIFRLKVAEDHYNDEARIKVSIYRLERLTDFVKEGNLMLQYIKALENGQPVLCTGGPSGSVAAAATAAGVGAGGSGGGGGYNPQGGGLGGGQYGGPSSSMYGTAPQATNPYTSAPATNPYVAPATGHAGGGPPRTPPPAGGGGGMYGGPPTAAGRPQQSSGGGMYGGPQQQQGGGGGYSGSGSGAGYGGPVGGGGYGGGGGGGWNGGGPPRQQQGSAGGGMYGGPPPAQQQNNTNNSYQVPPNAFW
ncbi:hypothetical protein VOLCADRAFT_104448 [Volvox carteri f. nagariensis]|uniref:Replication protein A subunit n=1 Tax=Volvox carteri f. nagariensis TaxID=3068 RepID=D8TTP6_VOLCA|nr:uncharacterized protein VOLCADRAFT_104448 [Volvox carteri f. nagariensis]EFJ49234.1 hypothetical protein VOLCADRAFT_104448 [Volvox carteri f. nagariensis]|eukprot:XP_002949682.1 hypothetical protein VOLCADRAFT_104448 [Volvox carteri f. nagariensis]